MPLMRLHDYTHFAVSLKIIMKSSSVVKSKRLLKKDRKIENKSQGMSEMAQFLLVLKYFFQH
jgi:hypothetical protein